MAPVAPPDLSTKLTTRRAKHSDLNRHTFRASLARRRTRSRNIPLVMTVKNDGHGSISMELREGAFGLQEIR